MITVVNKHKHIPTPKDVYIGRGSPLGNPYTHLKVGTKAKYVCETRTDAIAACKIELLMRIKNKDKVICRALNDLYKKAKTGDINLVCYCKDLPCHGDFIKELIDGKLQIYYQSQK